MIVRRGRSRTRQQGANELYPHLQQHLPRIGRRIAQHLPHFAGRRDRHIVSTGNWIFVG